MSTTPNLQPPACNLQPACRRGSIMVLVIVLIVLLAVMGMAYVQLARVDRLATSQIKPHNIDNVVAAVVEHIKFVLKDDLVNQAGRILDARANPTPVAAFARFTNADEAYDYPWTNDSVAFSVAPQYSTSADARGGQLDDMWLASSYLEQPSMGTTGGVRWGHITNLNGIFLDLPLPEPANASVPRWPVDGSAAGTAGEHVVDFAGGNVNRTDTNVAIVDLQASTNSNRFQPRGADADGDGIPDSRWTWAPIREIAGVNYVMAVRIIDNSSMVNVNTATAMLDGSGHWSTTGNDRPMGVWPTSVDLSRLFEASIGSFSTVRTAISRLFEVRNSPGGQNFPVPSLTTIQFPLAYLPRSQGDIYWGNSAFYGYVPLPQTRTPYLAHFAWADELSLRFGNGLRSSRFGQTALELSLHPPGNPPYSYDLLRTHVAQEKDQVDERNFVDIRASRKESPWSLSNSGDMLQFFVGTSGGQMPEIRKWLTTFSGASLLRPNVDPTGGALPPFMESVDLSPRRVTSWTAAQRDATRDQLRDALTRIFSIGPPMYLGLTTATEVEALAAQYTANILDYIDDDTPVECTTVSDAGGNNHYGLEPLPFLRQVYVQVQYRADDSDGDGTPETWDLQPNGSGVAVELGNPFDKDLNNLNDRVQIQVEGGGAVQTWTWSDVATDPAHLDAPISLGSGQSVVIYSNPSITSSQESALNDLKDNLIHSGAQVRHITDPGGTTQDGILSAPYRGDVTVRLLARTTNGWVIYDQISVGSFPGSGASVDTTKLPVPAPNERRYAQRSAARPCTDASGKAGPYYLQAGSEFSPFPPRDPDDSTPVATAAQTLLGTNNKGGTANVGLSKVIFRVPNRPIFNPAELAWICTVGFSNTTTFTENVATLLALPNPVQTGTDIPRGLFLDFSDFAEVPALPAGWPDNYPGVPHAALVLQALSTLSLQNDGYDNDNDDGDEDVATHADGDNTTAKGPYELFVPGTINVNTAPPQLLALAVPVPEAPTDLRATFDALARYRDVAGMNPTAVAGMRSGMLHLTTGSAAANIRTAPGIASLAETMWLFSGGSTNVRNMQRYAFDAAAATPAIFNLYPLPAESGTFATAPENDAEERIQRFQFINQVLTTRSDVFTAYVEIRGYPSDDWRKGPVEQARFLAVFDRGRMKVPDTPNGEHPDDLVDVRLIGMYRY